MKRRSNSRKVSMYMLIVSVSLLIVQSASANPSNPLQLLSPALEPHGQPEDQITQERVEPFINRVGNISLGSIDTFRNALVPRPDSSSRGIGFKGRHFVMTFFPEKEVTVIVDSESHPAHNVISLGGHQIDSDISTFSMTITGDNFLITYQDLVNAVTYRVVGEVETGLGKVVEIDLKKLPPRYDSEPVIPPGN